MQKIAALIYSEPVVTLTVVTGTTAVLANEHIIAGWIPLVALAVCTPIQRGLVTPTAKTVTHKVIRMVKRGGANSH